MGEADAEALLEEAGYEILEVQAPGSWGMEVDGEPVEVAVRADFLVSRDGATYVAEVKTGRLAPDPRHPATRRQLLEYAFAFQPDGLLLIDVEEGAIIEVRFPDLER